MEHLQLTDELQEKASFYASGAMPESERREYARHLEEDACAVCRLEVRELQSVASFLAFSLPSQTPSAAVISRLMAEVQPGGAGTPTGFRFEQAPAPRWIARAAGFVALAASILLTVALRDNSQLRRLADSLNSRIVELESQIDQQRLMLATLTSSDVRVVDLAGQGATPRAGARIFWDQPGRKWYVYVHGLPPAPGGQTYQLWFVPQTGKPVSANVFNTDPDGSARADVGVPENLGPLNAAAVTTEPAGGLLQPSGAFALLGRLE